MHRDGRITLPEPRQRYNRPGPSSWDPTPEPAPTTLAEVRPSDLRIVMGATREGRRWNEFVDRYHYLGYTTLVGARMRYAVHDRNGRPVAMLGFSTATWKLAPATASSDGPWPCAKRTFPSWSTTRASCAP